MNDRPASRRPKWIRVIHAAVANPIATALLFLLLWADACSIGNQLLTRSTIIGWMPSAPLGLGPVRAAVSPQLTVMFAVREPTGFRIIDPDNQSWDEATHLLAERPEDVIQIKLRRWRFRHGLWAPTTRATQTVIEFTPMGAPLSAEEGTTLRKEWVTNTLAPKNFIDISEGKWLQTGDRFSEERIWSGYIHNVIALLAFLALLFSLCWVPRAPSWLRERRVERALARGRCPTCGYDILGLPGHVCPECGKPIP